ncbi:MAG: glycoside hydrolase family 2 protein [Lentisphaeria bacterium]|nr:glycoside hydrolase family 2 protein [Lentisphaeria bacterium]
MIDLTLYPWLLTGKGKDGEELSLPCTVPGDNMSILLKNGVIPDPYFGENEKLVQWVGENDWNFICRFFLDQPVNGHHFYLNFDAVDTCAEISLNGKILKNCDNVFLRQRFFTENMLKQGENILKIHIHSAIAVGKERAAQYPFDLKKNNNNQIDHLQFIRKMQCSGGWDWGPCLSVAGIYGNIYLQEFDCARLENIHTEQCFCGDGADLTVHVELEAISSGTVPLKIEFNGERVEKNIPVVSGENHISHTFHVPSPKLWYPAGYGEQARYLLTVAAAGESIQKQIGFREVKLLTVPDGETSASFCFEINGKAIFCKGANWVPCEAMPGRENPERVEDLLRSAAAANMNMIRVWGGGKYETERFYDLCDELGLLVWQDCMFACAAYPDSAEFLASVQAELKYQTRRLSTHPCIALWCADNEMFMCFGQYHPSREGFKYAVLYDRVNRFTVSCLKEFTRGIPIRRSTPDRGENDFFEHFWDRYDKGDTHFFRVWMWNDPFSVYQTIKPRFVTEFGFQSIPSLRTLQKVLPPEQENISSPAMDIRQKNDMKTVRILRALCDHFYLPVEFAEQIYLSQVTQAVCIRTAVDAWRSRKPWCMGILYWQLNDIWQGFSWSSLDYYGEWKVLHYEARRFYAPTWVSAYERDGKQQVSVIHDGTAPVSGTLRIKWHRFDGRQPLLLSEQCLTVSPEKIFTADLPETAELPASGFYELEFNGIRREYFLRPFKECLLRKAELKIQVSKQGNRFEVSVTSDGYAFYVFAEERNVLCKWSDNAITLYPGETVTLSAYPEKEISLEDFIQGLHFHQIQNRGNES